MFPVLFQSGEFVLYSYGAFFAVGLLVAYALMMELARKSRIDERFMIRFLALSVAVGVLGSRVLQAAVDYRETLEHPGSLFYFWEARAFIGGPIAIVAFGIWYTRRHRVSPWKIVDLFGVATPLGHALGRFGCFLAGCCHGRATDVPWAMRFDSDQVDEALRGVPVHPTQLYEAIALLILGVALYRWFPRKRFDGEIGLAYFLAYPIIRFTVEIFRGDSERGFVFGGLMSTSQFVSVAIFASALGFLACRKRELRMRPESLEQDHRKKPRRRTAA
jgi:phosphatidylglycerol:prolipoprotein diacylglycerol transferase